MAQCAPLCDKVLRELSIPTTTAYGNWKGENARFPVTAEAYKTPSRFFLSDEQSFGVNTAGSGSQKIEEDDSRDGQAMDQRQRARWSSALRCSRQTQRMKSSNAGKQIFQRGHFQLRDSRRKAAEMLKIRHNRPHVFQERIGLGDIEESDEKPRRKVRFAGGNGIQPLNSHDLRRNSANFVAKVEEKNCNCPDMPPTFKDPNVLGIRRAPNLNFDRNSRFYTANKTANSSSEQKRNATWSCKILIKQRDKKQAPTYAARTNPQPNLRLHPEVITEVSLFTFFGFGT